MAPSVADLSDGPDSQRKLWEISLLCNDGRKIEKHGLYWGNVDAVNKVAVGL